MKKNIKLFVVTLIVSFFCGYLCIWLYKYISPTSVCSPTMEQQLQEDIRNLIQSKNQASIASIDTLLNAYPISAKTRVRKVEIDGTLSEVSNFKDYLIALITTAKIKQLEIKQLECNNQYIQTIILITQK